MPIVAVSGHARKVGKTSVAEGLIAALPQYGWTALKISSNWHAGASTDHDDSIIEESSAKICGEKSDVASGDTSRFLAAGARRAFWVRTRRDNMEATLTEVRALLADMPFVVIEGNDIFDYIHADFHILILNYGIEEFKASARHIIPRADAFVAVHENMQFPPSPPRYWQNFIDEASDNTSNTPLFATSDPKIVPAALLDLIRTRFPLPE